MPISYAVLQSNTIGPPQWLELARRIHELADADPGLDGLVVTHGTATLEETAYFLNLALKTDVPVVLTGAQRPATGLSTDGPMNLLNAVRVAGSRELGGLRGLGVLVVLNDEIQAAREVTKTSTLRLQTFRTADFGILGHADGDRVVLYRSPTRRHAPDTEFEVGELAELPRVDIVVSYAGGDGAMIRAAVEAGARGHRGRGIRPRAQYPGPARSVA